MPITLPKMRPSARGPARRTRGQRAHISRASIAKAAAILIEEDPHFSIRDLAKRLGVKTGAIHFHFPGTGAKRQLITEMVRTVLQPLARGFKPGESGYDYLRSLFWGAWLILHEHRNLALSVSAELSANLLISPLLLARTLAALRDAGLPDDDLTEGVEQILAGLMGFVSLEFPPARYQVASDWVDDLTAGLRGLPEDSDHAIAKERADDLVARAADRLTRLSGPKAKRAYADRFAEFVLRGVGVGPTAAKPRQRPHP
jgi:AcrR family transcriptional regulator